MINSPYMRRFLKKHPTYMRDRARARVAWLAANNPRKLKEIREAQNAYGRIKYRVDPTHRARAAAADKLRAATPAGREARKRYIKAYQSTPKGKFRVRECSRISRFRQHGFTLEQYRDMERHQKGRCACCGHRPTAGQVLQIHRGPNTKVKDLLCKSCGVVLQVTRDPIALGRTAAELKRTAERRLRVAAYALTNIRRQHDAEMD